MKPSQFIEHSHKDKRMSGIKQINYSNPYGIIQVQFNNF